MANNRTLNTSPMTILDLTDSRKLDVYISSNLPISQIKNANVTPNAYTPDWSLTNLVLTASVFLDSQSITTATLEWYTKNTDGTETKIQSTTSRVISGTTLTIKTNELANNNIMTYVCYATYQGITDRAELAFTRVDTGINGTNGSPGTPAPVTKAQYSVNGISNWTTTLDSANHKFIRLSYDGGNTWTAAIKIAGEDGHSVTVKGTAYYNGTLSSSNIGQNITLYSDSALTTILITSGLSVGDAYIVQGYLCVFANTTDKFVCTGTIQGPKGDQGTSSYTFIRYADNASGANMSTSPAGKTYIGVAITTINTAPTVASAYTWSKFVGDNAKSIILNADSQVFKVGQNNAITPSTISVMAQTLNTTVTTWTYSVDGGKTFLSTPPTGVSRSGSIVTVTGSTLTSNSLTIKASDGTYSDTLTVYKAFDGTNGNPGAPGSPAPLAFLTNENITFAANAEGKITGTTFTTNVIGYQGTTKVTPVIGIISGLPTGMTYSGSTTVGNELILSFTIANNATLGSASNINGSFTIPVTSPVTTSLKLNWSKVNSGHEGNGISSVTVSYGVSTSASTQPTEWQSTIPVVADGSYLWTRTITDYTDPNVADTVTYTYAKQGTQGQQGSQGSSVTVSSIQYQQGDSATAAPTGTWNNNVVSVAEGKYLWTKTTFSDSKVAYGVARQGVNGIDGDPGAPASLVTITPSALYFKSDTGKGGTFTPEYIYLYPRFQTVAYSNWQYSVNGGTTWINASGANGLTIGTYNSVANSLRISRSSTLYTDSITSISFRCNSNNAAIYDIVSIAKIYDVVDIEIGGRNLLRNSTNSYRTLNVTQYSGTLITMSYTDILNQGLNIGDSITFSVYVKTNSGKKLRARLEHYNNDSDRITSFGNNYIENGEGLLYVTTTLVDGYNQFRVQIDTNLTSSTHTTATQEQYKLEKLERGNKVTDWSPAPEDIIATASNNYVMLSNEAHLFEADSNGVPTPTSIVLDVIGYKGATQVSTTVGTISGKPSAGMTVSISNNNTKNTKINISIDESLTVDYGTLTIPITVDGKIINKIFSWSKSKEGMAGSSGSDAVTFQVYSSNGYILSKDLQEITLQTYAYKGDKAINAGAAYQWASSVGNGWTDISGATNPYLNVIHTDVTDNKSYKCTMTFEGLSYTYVVTVEDKSDIRQTFTSKPLSYEEGDLWIVGKDYIPNNFSFGTILKATQTRSTYSDSDWIAATNYDEMAKDIEEYNQYFKLDRTNGITMTAIDANNKPSPFSTTLGHNRLSFKQDEKEVAYISNNKLNITQAEIISPLTITGQYSGSTMLQAPTLNLGKFSLVVESNGSLSIIANM